MKALFSTLGASPRNVTAVRLAQPSKALSPILVTLSGIEMFVRPTQLMKANRPILVMLLGMTILSKVGLSLEGCSVSPKVGS